MKEDEAPIDPALPTPTPATSPGRDADARAEVPEPATIEAAPGRTLEDGRTSEPGILVAAGRDAAKAHVEAAVPMGAPPVEVDRTLVKIVDPRRLPTMRLPKPAGVTTTPSEMPSGRRPRAGAKRAESAPVKSVPPPAMTEKERERTSSAPPVPRDSGAKRGGWWLWAVLASVVGVVVVLLLWWRL